MTRSEYIAAIKVVTDYFDELNAAGKALGIVASGGVAPVIEIGARMCAKYIEMIQERMGDTGRDSWTTWYLWEVYGSKDGMKCEVGGKDYTVRTAGQVYDVIKRWKKLQQTP